jgi:recombination protein RecR
MDIVDKLTEFFKEFPGIGERQARRFVYFLMSRNGEYSNNLAKTILDLKKDISQCKECYKFFILPARNATHSVADGEKGSKQICEICADPNLDTSLLMVLEKDTDLESVRKSKVYGGKFFVLGGLVPIVEKNTKRKVRVEELNPQGDHTDHYIRGELKELVELLNIKISSLGRGMSTGTELEYSDNDTLRNALKNRQ